MVQNDFLYPLFSLNPAIVALLIWFWGFGYLFLLGIKTGVVNIIFRTPGIIFGDFLILPTITYLIAFFYQKAESIQQVRIASSWDLIAGVVALLLTLISAVRFKFKGNPVSVWYLPHVVFYWFMAYMVLNFLSKGLYYLLFFNWEISLFVIWAIVSLGILTHQTLGVIRPKVFPKI